VNDADLAEMLDDLRLRVMLHGWGDLTEREARILQMSDYSGGCPSCGSQGDNRQLKSI
jgi:hypothetical protein